MLIDGFTVLAQIVNFLLLVWLLKRFLYGPLIRALDARERRIAAELAEASRQAEAAAVEEARYRQLTLELEQQRCDMLSAARSEAEAERQRLMQALKQEIAARQQELERKVAGEARAQSEQFARRTQQEAFALARKALADLTDSELDERLLARFIERLHSASPEERAQLALLAGDDLLLRSARPLSQPALDALAAALRQAGLAAPLRIEPSPDLVGGIELIGNGRKIDWSFADYLAQLEQQAGRELKRLTAEAHHGQ